MAANDLIEVQRQTLENPSTNGVIERVTLSQFMALLPGGTTADASVAGTPVVVIRQTAPAAAAVPFADLTAAANSFNALRTALIAAKVLV